MSAAERTFEADEGFEEEPYEVARRLYGRHLEPETRRELQESLEAWRGLASADRTFVLAHLGMLQLRALERLGVGEEPGAEERGAGDGVGLGEIGEVDAVTEEASALTGLRAMGDTSDVHER